MSEEQLSSTTLFTRFEQEIQALLKSVDDAEHAFVKKHLSRDTRDHVVELCLIRAMGLFEEYIGDLFALALKGKLGAEIKPKFLAKTDEEVSLLVSGSNSTGTDRYVSWLPFKKKTMDRADILLENGLPFSRLSNRSSEKNELTTLTTVRNAIAHDSESARAKFRQLAVDRGYPHSRAADYLTGIRLGESEIILGLSNLRRIAHGLSVPTDADSRQYLSPEDLFLTNIIAPPGEYECVRCKAKISHTTHEKLPECISCVRPTPCPNCGAVSKVVTKWERT